jgi:hypothetical protein
MKGLLLLVASALSAWAQSNAPQQIHLAYYGSNIQVNDGMTVSWVTMNATATTGCKYGLTPSLGSSAQGIVETYLSVEKGGSFNHHTSITGLQPGTTYYYSCGDDAAGWSPVHHFKTAPAADADINETFFVVYGDQGIYNSHESMELVASLVNQSPFIWHIGDISYADDGFLHFPLEFVYEQVSSITRG